MYVCVYNRICVCICNDRKRVKETRNSRSEEGIIEEEDENEKKEIKERWNEIRKRIKETAVCYMLFFNSV